MIKGEKPVLVDFFATWCGPCKAMHPVLEELKKEMGEQIHIVKVDIDIPANRLLVTQHNIQSVPTFMILKKGEMLWRHSGMLRLTQLKAKIREFL